MLEARRKGWLGFALTVTDGEREVGEVCVSCWAPGGTLTLDERRLTVRRQSFWNQGYVLEEGGARVASAARKHVFRRVYELATEDATLTLLPTSFFLGTFELRAGTRQLGGLRARGMFWRRVEIDLPDVMPLELRLFTLWLVALQWRQAAAGA